MRSWSELCVELLELIVKQLWAIEDTVHFRAVCRLWRSVPIKKQQFSPRLMLAAEGYNYYSFYGPLTQKVCRLNLPEVRGRRCWTSGGLLITYGFDTEEILLVNPFSHEKIWLPPLPTEPNKIHPALTCQLYVEKLILSSSPRTTPLEDDEEKCVAMVITTRHNTLAFLRMGDEVWTLISIHKTIISDVVYFHGQFYAITCLAELLMVDISGTQPKTTEIAEGIEHPDLNLYPFSCYYLVESAGELFLLARYLCIGVACVIQTTGFGVFKFNFDNRMWTKVRSLDNCAIFVGDYTSFSIFPSNKFEWQPNCIYFTNDIQPGSSRKKDIGVFRLDTQGIQDFFNCCGIDCYACAALWVRPSLSVKL